MIRFWPLLGPTLWFLPDVTPPIGLALALTGVYLLYHRSRGRLSVG